MELEVSIGIMYNTNSNLFCSFSKLQLCQKMKNVLHPPAALKGKADDDILIKQISQGGPKQLFLVLSGNGKEQPKVLVPYYSCPEAMMLPPPQVTVAKSANP